MRLFKARHDSNNIQLITPTDHSKIDLNRFK